MMRNPAVLASCLGLCAAASAAPTYVASVIELEARITDQHYADLNGDGRQDLLLAVWSEQGGRELLLYPQAENGGFGGQPAERIEVKKDIVAWALGDVRAEAGEELVLFTRSGAYSYSSRKQGYAGNLQKLLDWDFLVSVPAQKSLGFLGRLRDYNGDRRLDLLLPGRHQYGIALGRADGSVTAVRPLPRPYDNPRQAERNDLSVDLSFEEGLSLGVQQASPFAGLFPARGKDGNGSGWTRFGEGASILDAQHWIAALQAVELDGDHLLDFAYIDDSEGEGWRFNAIFGAGEGLARGRPDWQSPLRESRWLQFHDLDGDRQSEVLALSGRGEDQGSLAIFRNRGGRFDFSKADQVMRFSGYEVEAQVQDLDADSKPELIVSYYSIAPVDALRKGGMLRSTLIYRGGDDSTFFAGRPTARLEESFSADSVKGLGARLDFSADIDGDGRRDMVGLDAAGALVGKHLGQDLQPAAEAAWRYVPLHLVQRLHVAHLNEDARSDFLLRHQNAITLLVSQP